MIYGFPDMESASGPSPCQQAIRNSRGLNAKKINFMITVYGVHKGRTFDRWGTQQQQMQREQMSCFVDQPVRSWHSNMAFSLVCIGHYVSKRCSNLTSTDLRLMHGQCLCSAAQLHVSHSYMCPT
jgi:hypothetical protein